MDAAATFRAYDWSGHDVHYRGLMHTIADMPNPLIVLIRPQPDKRAFRPRLPMQGSQSEKSKHSNGSTHAGNGAQQRNVQLNDLNTLTH